MVDTTADAWASLRWPADDAPSLDWARFYRAIGLEVRPTPSPVDRLEHARYLSDEAERDYRDQHKQDPPEDLAVAFYDDARAYAEDVRGPVPKVAAQFRGRRATDEDLVRWFTPAHGTGEKRTRHHIQRGVCCLLDDACPWAQVDVDPRSGGDVVGPYATLPGPKVTTPRGGVHVFVLRRGAPGEAPVRASAGKSALAPGVEVRTAGSALLPSGAATPDRRWTCRDAPVPAPASLRARPRPVPADRSTGGASAWDPDIDGGGLGRVAYLIATDAEEGTRNASGAQVVGLLARPRGVPDDVLRALLALLGEYGTGMDWPAARLAEEAQRWQALLTRGPRDAEFAAEVLAAWVSVRDNTSRPWRPGKARALARSVWKTADRREEGNAGGEDMGHAGDVGEWDDGPPPLIPTRPAPPPPPVPGDMPQAPASTDPPPVADVDPTAAFVADVHAPTAVSEAVAASNAVPLAADGKEAEKAARFTAICRAILPTLRQSWPMEARLADFKRRSIPLESLFLFVDFRTGRLETETQDPHGRGHGLGELSRAIGGLRAGRLLVWGAAGGKAGKTHFVGQCVEGVALATAARLLGVPGYEDAPIVMPVWVTELVEDGEVAKRMASRHLGFDMAALEEESGERAPGVARMAADYSTTSAQVVRRAWDLANHYWRDRDPLGCADSLIVRELDTTGLPPPQGHGRGRVDQSTGPNLVGWIAHSVRLYQAELAAAFGVPEEQVVPWVLFDPGQRFTGEDESSKAALDALLNAVVNRLCRSRQRGGLGAAVWMTSDTTKAAAKDMDLQRFLSEPGQRLAADIFAGSQGVMHAGDTVAMCGEDNPADPLNRTQWVRVLQSRTGAPPACYPFDWQAHTGRFRARPLQPLRAVDPDHDPRGRRPPPPKVGEYAPTHPGAAPSRPPAFRPNGVRYHPGESEH